MRGMTGRPPPARHHTPTVTALQPYTETGRPTPTTTPHNLSPRAIEPRPPPAPSPVADALATPGPSPRVREKTYTRLAPTTPDSRPLHPTRAPDQGRPTTECRYGTRTSTHTHTPTTPGPVVDHRQLESTTTTPTHTNATHPRATTTTIAAPPQILYNRCARPSLTMRNRPT